jgi:hypothetical protein
MGIEVLDFNGLDLFSPHLIHLTSKSNHGPETNDQ